MCVEEWSNLLAVAERPLGFDQGFKMLFCSWATLTSADTAFLSLMPGNAPVGAELRTFSDERGNSYRIEETTTRSPITEQFLLMAEFLGLKPEEILTGVVAPFRSPNWEDLTNDQRAVSLAVGRLFWAGALKSSKVRLIIATSEEASALAIKIMGASLEEAIPSGWGATILRRLRTSDGRRIVHLPLLSRYKLFSRPACAKPLQQIFQL